MKKAINISEIMRFSSFFACWTDATDDMTLSYVWLFGSGGGGVLEEKEAYITIQPGHHSTAH